MHNRICWAQEPEILLKMKYSPACKAPKTKGTRLETVKAASQKHRIPHRDRGVVLCPEMLLSKAGFSTS